MAASSSSMKVGATFSVKADKTFTVVHGGATMKFKLRPDGKTVELISIEEPAPTSTDQATTHASDWTPGDVLSRYGANAFFLLPLDVADMAGLAKSLPFVKPFSDQVSPSGSIKPQIFIRSHIVDRPGARAKFNRAVRDTLGGSKALDAHIIAKAMIMKK